MSIEIFGRLETALPSITLNAHTLSRCRTIVEIVTEVLPKSSYPSSPRVVSEPQSQISSPRTLVADDTLPEPTPFAVDSDLSVQGILAAVLDISPKEVDMDVELENLGLDSLTSIEALAALKNEFGLDLPGTLFNEHCTARKVQSYLSCQLSLKSSVPPSKLPVRDLVTYRVATTGTVTKRKSEHSITISPMSVTRLTKALKLDIVPLPLQKSASQALPLFLMHDGSGLINYYNGIKSLGRQVWGFNNPHFATSEPWSGVSEMAAAYAKYISNITRDSVILGGTRFCSRSSSKTDFDVQVGPSEELQHTKHLFNLLRWASRPKEFFS
jgi:acyl carrier protein